MSETKINNHLLTDYVSDVDIFLSQFRNSHQLSESQRAEIAKHKGIFEKRDNPDASHTMNLFDTLV